MAILVLALGVQRGHRTERRRSCRHPDDGAGADRSRHADPRVALDGVQTDGNDPAPGTGRVLLAIHAERVDSAHRHKAQAGVDDDQGVSEFYGYDREGASDRGWL